MQKRAQFYLVAALVIIGIVVGLATTYNYAAAKKQDTTIYDLSKEINFESAQVIDNGVFNEKDFAENLETLTTFYSQQNPDSDLIVIYGDESEITAIYYNSTNTGSIGLSLDGSEISLTITNPKQTELRPEDSLIQIYLTDALSYDFTLRSGKIFYIIIKKERQDETYIAA